LLAGLVRKGLCIQNSMYCTLARLKISFGRWRGICPPQRLPDSGAAIGALHSGHGRQNYKGFVRWIISQVKSESIAPGPYFGCLLWKKAAVHYMGRYPRIAKIFIASFTGYGIASVLQCGLNINQGDLCPCYSHNPENHPNFLRETIHFPGV